MDPTFGRAKAGLPARTCIQQLCEDTGCGPEDLPEVMNDREKWRERERHDDHHDDDLMLCIFLLSFGEYKENTFVEKLKKIFF